MYAYPSKPPVPRLLTSSGKGGGMPLTQNRTKWPVKGGAVALQPGWFPGHPTAYFYINLGEGTLPINMSLPMVPVFQIVGPTKDQYDGGFCLPQVPLPVGFNAKVGDNATIQVVEAALHGAALYSVSPTAVLPRFVRHQLTWIISVLTLPLLSRKMLSKSMRTTASTHQTSVSNSYLLRPVFLERFHHYRGRPRSSLLFH